MNPPSEASNFFVRLLQQSQPAALLLDPDDITEFERACNSIQNTLAFPDERQLAKGIHSTEVPRALQSITHALVYEASFASDYTFGGCMEYFVQHHIFSSLVEWFRDDRPYGLQCEIVRAADILAAQLPDRVLLNGAIHEPLRRLVHYGMSAVFDEPTRIDGSARALGAASADRYPGQEKELESSLVNLMFTICGRIKAWYVQALGPMSRKQNLMDSPKFLLIFMNFQPSLGTAPATESDFRSTADSFTQPDSSGTTSSGSQGRHECPIFSNLLRFVHRECVIGDIARLSLDSLFDTAFGPTNRVAGPLYGPAQDDDLFDARFALATFILESDFADVMAAGLGAIWSLLATKLTLTTPGVMARAKKGLTVMVVGLESGLSTETRAEQRQPIPLSTQVEILDQHHMMRTFTAFVQGLTARCTRETDTDHTVMTLPIVPGMAPIDMDAQMCNLGRAIVSSVVCSVRSSFIRNVVYPSILECSSTDGSAVAIMAHLICVFSNLPEGPIVTAMLDDLLDLCSRDSDAGEAAETRFTLKDLIIENLRSTNPQATLAAGQLTRVLVKNYCGYATEGLLPGIYDHPLASDNVRPPTTPDQTGQAYANLVEQLNPHLTPLNQSAMYQKSLADIYGLICTSECYISLDNPCAHSERHSIPPDDTLVRTLLFGLGQLFVRLPEENIALTGAIMSTALCPTRSLAGWMTTDPDPDPQNTFFTELREETAKTTWDLDSDLDDDPELSEDEKRERELRRRYKAQRSQAKGRRQATRNGSSVPPRSAIHQVLDGLMDNIKTIRQAFPTFDQVLFERRNGLMSDKLAQTLKMTLALPCKPTPSLPSTTPVRTPVPKKKPGMMGTLASYLTPSKKEPSPEWSTPSSLIDTPPQVAENAETGLGPATPDKGKGREKPSDEDAVKAHYQRLAGQYVEVETSHVGHGAWRSAPPAPPNPQPAGTFTDYFGRQIPTPLLQTAPVLRGVTNFNTVRKRVYIGHTLDNVIILEQFCIELVAIINARKALGIDTVDMV